MACEGRPSFTISLDFSGALVRFGWDLLGESMNDWNDGYQFLRTKIFEEPCAVYYSASSEKHNAWEIGRAAKEEYKLNCGNKSDFNNDLYFDNIVACLQLVNPSCKNACTPTWPFSNLSLSTTLVRDKDQASKALTFQQILSRYFLFVRNTLFGDIKQSSSSAYSLLPFTPITWVILIPRDLSSAAQDLLYYSFHTLGIQRKELVFITSPYATLSLYGAIHDQLLLSSPKHSPSKENMKKCVMIVELNTSHTDFSLFEAVGLDKDGHIHWKSLPITTLEFYRSKTGNVATNAIVKNNDNESDANDKSNPNAGISSLTSRLILWLKSLTDNFQQVISRFPQDFNKHTPLDNLWTEVTTRYYEQLVTDKLSTFLASASVHQRKYFHISLLSLLPDLAQREYFSLYLNHQLSQEQQPHQYGFQAFSGNLFLNIHNFLIPHFVEPSYLEPIHQRLHQITSTIQNNHLSTIIISGEFSANRFLQEWFSNKYHQCFHRWMMSDISHPTFMSSASTEYYNQEVPKTYFNVTQRDIPATNMAVLGGLLIIRRLTSSQSIPPLNRSSSHQPNYSPDIAKKSYLNRNQMDKTRNSSDTSTTVNLHRPLFAEAKDITASNMEDRTKDLLAGHTSKLSKESWYFSHKYECTNDGVWDKENALFSSQENTIPVRKASFSLPPMISPAKYQTHELNHDAIETAETRHKSSSVTNPGDIPEASVYGMDAQRTERDTDATRDVSRPIHHFPHPHVHLHPPTYRFHYRTESLSHPFSVLQQQRKQQQHQQHYQLDDAMLDANEAIDPLEERFVHRVPSLEEVPSSVVDSGVTTNEDHVDRKNTFENQDFVRSIDGWQLDTNAFENVHSSISIETIFSSPSVTPSVTPSPSLSPSLSPPPPPDSSPPPSPIHHRPLFHEIETAPLPTTTTITTPQPMPTSASLEKEMDDHPTSSPDERTTFSFQPPKSILHASFFLPPSTTPPPSQFSSFHTNKPPVRLTHKANNDDDITILSNDNGNVDDANVNLTQYNTIINAEIGKSSPDTAVAETSTVSSSWSTSSVDDTMFHAHNISGSHSPVDRALTLKPKKTTRFSFIRQPLPVQQQTTMMNRLPTDKDDAIQSRCLSVTSSFWSFRDHHHVAARSSPVNETTHSIHKGVIKEVYVQDNEEEIDEEEEEEEDVRSYNGDFDLKSSL